MDLSERNAASTARHPWEIARARFFLDLVKAEVPLDRPLACMDVGCGDAWFLGRLFAELPTGSDAWGLDTGLDVATLASVERSAAPGLKLRNKEPDETFDLLCLMDVCEHVEDDLAFLRGLVDRRLRRGGWVLFSVPAWPALYSSHDTALRHFRRYTPAAARTLLDSAGLEIAEQGGLFHSLILPRAAQVALERLREPAAPSEVTGVGSWNGSPLVTRAVTLALEADGVLSRAASALGVQVPGLSWWALCRKRS